MEEKGRGMSYQNASKLRTQLLEYNLVKKVEDD
jgi:hypothetical protein